MNSDDNSDSNNLSNAKHSPFLEARSQKSFGVLGVLNNVPRSSSKFNNEHFKSRKNPNITTSLYHFSNLQHINPVPFYRISTPKAPLYSVDMGAANAAIGSDPDDKYIIPIENYKTMNIK